MRAILGLIAAISPLWAWGDEGHQIIAYIAAVHLRDNAVQRVAALLCRDSDLNPQPKLSCDGQDSRDSIAAAMAAAAIWPDHMPGGKGATAPWHYIDIGLFEDPANMMARCPAEGCIVSKLNIYLTNLKDHRADGEWPEYKELEFMIHFFGDVHQPLHCASNADAGGNCERTIGYPTVHVLHAAWDIALVKEVMTGDIPATANALRSRFEPQAGEWSRYLPISQVVSETFFLARDKVYGIVPGMPVIQFFKSLSPRECAVEAPPAIRNLTIDGPAVFGDSSRDIVSEQLFKAGLRLAAALNDLYGQ